MTNFEIFSKAVHDKLVSLTHRKLFQSALTHPAQRYLADGVWVIDHCKTLLKPGGVSGYERIVWEPVTEEVSKFYNSEAVKGECRSMQETG